MADGARPARDPRTNDRSTSRLEYTRVPSAGGAMFELAEAALLLEFAES